MSDPSWPSDLILILSLGKSNWPQWCKELELSAEGQGFARYLDGSFPCPDKIKHPRAHHIWDNNDRSLRGFILRRVSPDDYEFTSHIHNQGAHTIFALRQRHEQLGLYSQVLLLRKALDIRFDMSKNIDKTVTELKGMYNQFIISMGNMDADKLFTILLINALGDQFPRLLSSIISMSMLPGFSSVTVTRLIHEENILLKRYAGQYLHPISSSSTAHAAMSKDRPRTICSNCKRPGHTVEFCIRQGGKMAGQSLDEARAAQHASLLKARRGKGHTAHVATTTGSTTSPVSATTLPTPSPAPAGPPILPAPPPTASSIVVNGVIYYSSPTSAPTPPSISHTALATVPEPSWNPASPTSSSICGNITHMLPPMNLREHPSTGHVHP